MTMTDASPVITSTSEALAAMEAAAGLLRRLGFEHRYSSMKSEACYYGQPGRTEVIRIASHGRKHKRRNGGCAGRVAATITFGANQGAFSWPEIFRRTCEAVGRYEFAMQAINDREHQA